MSICKQTKITQTMLLHRIYYFPLLLLLRPKATIYIRYMSYSAVPHSTINVLRVALKRLKSGWNRTTVHAYTIVIRI